MLFDTHCHIDYFDENIQNDIVADAFDSGLAKFVTICTKVSQFEKILNVALKDERIFCTIGNHPENVDEEESINILELLKVCKSNKKIIAIGETGLDYYHKKDNKEKQIEQFLHHIELASLADLPIVVHCRDAWDDVFKIIENCITNGLSGEKFIIHCFTGGIKEVLRLNELNCYVSISGIITFKNATTIKEGILNINPERLIIETDSPFLAPVPFRGKQNRPSYVKYVLDELCTIFNKDISEQLYTNSLRVFNLK